MDKATQKKFLPFWPKQPGKRPPVNVLLKNLTEEQIVEMENKAGIPFPRQGMSEKEIKEKNWEETNMFLKNIGEKEKKEEKEDVKEEVNFELDKTTTSVTEFTNNATKVLKEKKDAVSKVIQRENEELQNNLKEVQETIQKICEHVEELKQVYSELRMLEAEIQRRLEHMA